MNGKALISVGTSAALLISGIVLVVFTTERDIGGMLILSALAAAGIPAIKDSVPQDNPKPPPPSPIGVRGVGSEPYVPPAPPAGPVEPL